MRGIRQRRCRRGDDQQHVRHGHVAAQLTRLPGPAHQSPHDLEELGRTGVVVEARLGGGARCDHPEIGLSHALPLMRNPRLAVRRARRGGRVLRVGPDPQHLRRQQPPAPEATDVRRKRDSADQGSSSCPRADRAWSVSREVSSSAIRRTSTSLLGKRR